MPRRAPLPTVPRATVIFTAAAASLFPTLGNAGYVAIDQATVVSQPQTRPSQVLVNDLLEPQAVVYDAHDDVFWVGLVDDSVVSAAAGGIARGDGMMGTSRTGAGVAEVTPLAIGLDRPVAVPLPAPVWAGAIGLATAAWMTRRRKRTSRVSR